MTFLIYQELRAMQKQGFSTYIKDFWNIIDIIIINFYVATTISDLLYVDYYTVNLLYCINVILFTIKLMYYLRVINGFSFLVSML